MVKTENPIALLIHVQLHSHCDPTLVHEPLYILEGGGGGGVNLKQRS